MEAGRGGQVRELRQEAPGGLPFTQRYKTLRLLLLGSSPMPYRGAVGYCEYGEGDSKLQQLPLQNFLHESRTAFPLECRCSQLAHSCANSVPKLSVSSSLSLRCIYCCRFVANITAELQKSKPCEGAIGRELMERELEALNRDRESIEKKLGLPLSSFAGARQWG